MRKRRSIKTIKIITFKDILKTIEPFSKKPLKRKQHSEKWELERNSL